MAQDPCAIISTGIENGEWGNLQGYEKESGDFLFQLIALVIVIILISAAVIVFDGVTDRGDKADAVLVTGHVHHGEGKNDPLLDHVVEMYKTGKDVPSDSDRRHLAGSGATRIPARW